MSYWLDKFEAIIDEQKQKETELSIEEIPSITLAEFARRDMAVEIYSELLNCKLWLCSNDEMTVQIKRDAPGAVCYTVSELRELIRLKPGLESLRSVHDIKVIFPCSTIKETNIKARVEDEDHLSEEAGIDRARLIDDES